MLVKAYFLVWALGALSAIGFYLTGNLDMRATIVFGFLTFGALYMGMMMVLPYALTHSAGDHSHSN